MDREKISRERLSSPPGEVYTDTILRPSYEFMLAQYFWPLVETNKAWTVMLVDAGIIAEETGAALLRALLLLEADGPAALGEFDPRYEYFYSHMERYLIERAGDAVAGEINIGRTRPEPLARMVTRERLLSVCEAVAGLRRLLLHLAEQEAATVMPQWTHLQHAQLSTVGHYFLGIAEALERDHTRLLAAYATVNQSTLGCGALAGTSYPVDRQLVADLLGFDGFKRNTIDCVSSGDYMLESAAVLANLMTTLSRFSQDLHTWSSWEFGLVETSDEYSGSSSMMPQKKNAYPFEYVRARAAHAVGEMTSAFGTLHNTHYQDLKDVEEEMVFPVFRGFDLVDGCTRLLQGTVGSLTFNRDRMRASAAQGFATATELAAAVHRVSEDLSYRGAHRLVGTVVRRAIDERRDATEVDAAFVEACAEGLFGRGLGLDDETVRAALDPEAFVEAHDVPGGPSSAALAEALGDARDRLRRDEEAIAGRRRALAEAHALLAERVGKLTGAR